MRRRVLFLQMISISLKCVIIDAMNVFSHEELAKKVPWFHREYLIVLVTILVITLLTAAGAFTNLEYNAFDSLMKVKKAPVERTDVVMVAIDDDATENVGQFPWPRDILGDVIMRMRELGARKVVFDIEYPTASVKGLNRDVEKQLPGMVAEAGDNVSGYLGELLERMADPQSYGLTDDEILDLGIELYEDYIPAEFDAFYEDVAGSVIRDNDMYFAKSLRFFGDSWLGSNMQDLGVRITEEYDQWITNNKLIKNVSDDGGYIARESNYFFNKRTVGRRGFAPALQSMVEAAAGFGYCNVWLDDDGVRRRVKLFYDHNDGYVGQLTFAPMLSELQPTRIIREKARLTLKDAHIVNADGQEEIKDMVIPLDKDGNVVINWTQNKFLDSYTIVSAYDLVRLDDLEDYLIGWLQKLTDTYGVAINRASPAYVKEAKKLVKEYDSLEKTREKLFNRTSGSTIDDPDFDVYFEGRKSFFNKCMQLSDMNYQQEIMDYWDTRMEKYAHNPAEVTRCTNERAGFVALYSAYRDAVESYYNADDYLSRKFSGAFCIIGHTATGSTDLGNTPFETGFPNIGTHANVYNTIMNQDFITPTPWYYGIVIASLLLILITISFRSTGMFAQNMSYFIGLVAFLAIIVALFVTTQIYIEVVAGAIIMVVGAIGQVALRFAKTAKEKGFIRQAFGTYLSPAVIDEIIKDPSKLSLGGEEKYLTAMFTDIRSFSTLSEKVTPTQLVSFLNKYLTRLSDIILENGGTIDKYEGDAIIAFFGAPISFEDHAWRAAISAVRMKQAEADFNTEMLAAGIIPTPVYTRIGLNTGDMVVGNMGTDAKMNYTMMGNAVNLAARLEGVNKVYHSWILVSEATWNGANSGEHEGVLLGRRFDRVRVVGINTPVQLVNILGVKSELDPALIESVDLFHKGLDCYLAKDFAKGKEFFDQATALYPSDEAASVFAERCATNLANGVPDEWDGVVNMTSK